MESADLTIDGENKLIKLLPQELENFKTKSMEKISIASRVQSLQYSDFHV